MTLRLRNAQSRSVEPFVPLDPAGKTVLVYSCGPTVYSFAHIGNFRSFLMADVLRRVLERRGYVVRHVMNITDVGHMTEDHLADAEGEDKLVKAAREIGKNPYDVARYFEDAFVRDAKALRLAAYGPGEADDRSRHPRATDYVAHMLELVQRLLDGGHAYIDVHGQAYFRISSFPAYGTLSGKQLDELEVGSRVAVREEKEDPRDFALWKVDPKHLMQWDPHGPEGWDEGGYDTLRERVPGGMHPDLRRGFPGWHIECSAMARACLGDVLDIHTGGEDNLFPHHECENAQSVCALHCSVPSPDGTEQRPSFARYWVHCRHLLVDQRKMSKRDGTFFTVRELLDPRDSPSVAARLAQAGFEGGVPANQLRCALISTEFGKHLNFTFELLRQARATVTGMQAAWQAVREAEGPPSGRFAAALQAFDDALDDNLDMSRAFDVVVELLKRTPVDELDEADRAALRDALEQIDAVLGLLERSVQSGRVSREQLTAMLEELDASPMPALGDPLAPTDVDAITRQLALRHQARSRRDFAAADRIREGLRAAGVVIEDVADGVRWRFRASP